MPKLRRTFLFIPVLALAAAGCPKNGKVDGGTNGSPHAKASPSPKDTPLVFSAAAQRMLTLGLGAGRVQWDDPPLRPGESVTWNVISSAADTPHELTVTRPAGATDRWILRAKEKTLELTVATNGGAATSMRWTDGSAAPVVVSRPDQLASLFTPPRLAGESSFKSEGGTMMGNEVVRVPAGNFRARHGSLHLTASTLHFYVAHSVPGGLVKLEEFPDGADDAALVLELEEFTRLKEPLPSP